VEDQGRRGEVCGSGCPVEGRSGMRPGSPTVRASGPRVSHGIARCPAAAGSPLRAQLVLMTSVQSRTGESSTSAAISPRVAGGRRVGGRSRHPSTSRRARSVGLLVGRRIRWPRQRRRSRCGRGSIGRCRLGALLRCCGSDDEGGVAEFGCGEDAAEGAGAGAAESVDVDRPGRGVAVDAPGRAWSCGGRDGDVACVESGVGWGGVVDAAPRGAVAGLRSESPMWCP
jgi:hypothetical protein